MKGQMLILKPKIAPETHELSARPSLDDIRAKLGGWLETVPYFTSIKIADQWLACVAFCDEEGKVKQLPFNGHATALWQQTLLAQGHSGLLDAAGLMSDWLVGPIVVLIGDAEFIRSLHSDDDI